MDKRLIERDNSIIPTLPSSPTETAEVMDSGLSPISFCIDPDDPIIGQIRAGREVSYELIKSDTGQYYAINIRLVRNKTTG